LTRCEWSLDGDDGAKTKLRDVSVPERTACALRQYEIFFNDGSRLSLIELLLLLWLLLNDRLRVLLLLPPLPQWHGTFVDGAGIKPPGGNGGSKGGEGSRSVKDFFVDDVVRAERVRWNGLLLLL
jgi:hypothetical protein